MTQWQQLTIYIGESNRWQQKPLYMAIVELARHRGIAGATVTRAIVGFGKNSHLRTTNLLALSSDLPIVVTIIDQEPAITHFIPVIKEMVKDGLVTLESVEIIHHAPII